ncbi:FAD/NAD(P)-binding protein [Rhizobium wuzhouense]|uniref:Hydroxyacylglutathione hydrolase n=1 Tax=Rhizobium wuzhouense TaxID=1986026 RepID=A0ABX5NKT4_9HYPH|nr:FAD/NAD(P)-binding protein [Rhizobium wuzhouense]PYB70273.1 hydroxyacylglutathione hydrolase [Rhizobium wuzhouense]
MSKPSQPLIVAIIGGGFTGAAVAAHLFEGDFPVSDVKVVVAEPRDQIGRGLAYGATDPAHRINVPAGKMTLFPDRSEDFSLYLDGPANGDHDPGLIAADGLAYPKRSVFGDYVHARLRPLLDAARVEHWQSAIVSLVPEGRQWRLTGTDGKTLVADLVVLAVSHPAPALPRTLLPLKDDPKLIADGTVPNALDAVSPDDRVLIVGNGLTSADMVASLQRLGHRGAITSISRRGLRSRGHGPVGQEAFGDFVSKPSVRASALLSRIRRAIREAEVQGLSWHSVLDAVRIQGQQIWPSLTLAEKRRIVRHVRPFWDVHRFRIAPQVEAVIDDAIASGRMTSLAAALKSVTRSGDAFQVVLQPRRGAAPVSIEVDAIIVTTGPAHGDVLDSQPLLLSLKNADLLQPCPTGLGIACDVHARALSADPTTPGLLIAGPLARGTFGELMGLPQVTEHAVLVAQQIKDSLARHRAGGPILSRAS